MSVLMTIELSEEDARDVLAHIARGTAGRQLVAVVNVIDADPEIDNPRPMSRADCAEALESF